MDTHIDQTGSTRERFESLTPRSKALHEAALGLFPDGVSRSSLVMDPYPVVVDRGEGAYLVDVDGRRILDFGNGNHSLLLGHANPDVVNAVTEQVKRGLSFLLMSRPEIELAGAIQERVPSMERMRFTCSGTEATMFAIRVARAFTGRTKFARMEGSYHGTHDMMCVGTFHAAPMGQPGTEGKPVGYGIPLTLADEVEFLPFNDLDACRRIIRANKSQFAALIVEPVMGGAGTLPAEPEFLLGLRDLCNEDGIALIFDEMITMGLAPGGAQEMYGVTPDLTTTGKVVGGGVPMGVFGGRADMMAMCERGTDGAKVFHTSALNAHPLAMVAGLAQLRELTSEAYERLHVLGDYLRESIRKVCDTRQVAVQVTGIGHLLGILFTDQSIRTGADTRAADIERARRMHVSLLSRGYYMPECRRGSVSTAMTEADIDAFIEAFDEALQETAVA